MRDRADNETAHKAAYRFVDDSVTICTLFDALIDYELTTGKKYVPASGSPRPQSEVLVAELRTAFQAYVEGMAVFVLVVGAGSYDLHWSKVESVWASRQLAAWRGEWLVAQIAAYDRALNEGDWSYECGKQLAETMPEIAKLLEGEESDLYTPTLSRDGARFEVIELPLLTMRPVSNL